MTNPTQVSNPNSIKPDAVVAAFTGAIRASSLHANQNTFGGYAKPMKDEPFVLSKISDYSWLRPAIDMLPTDKRTTLKGIVVDLRKLRFRPITMSSEWPHLIYGYDLLVILPEFTAANLYQ